jgi:pSer/pThr/pTyr-binding forkhead associated (FHA) protein
MNELLSAPEVDVSTEEAAVPLLSAHTRVPDATAPGRYLALQRGGEVQLVPLDREFTRVGRSPAADVMLDEASVSRRHAILVRRGETTVILDDRSLNGVFVNGERIGEAPLRDGDQIALGRVHARFVESR